MPWHLVDKAIDVDFNYSASEACQKHWTNVTGRTWSNADDPMIKILNCPYCQVPNHVPWTTCGKGETSKGEDVYVTLAPSWSETNTDQLSPDLQVLLAPDMGMAN
jgi:hypothetical protein